MTEKSNNRQNYPLVVSFKSVILDTFVLKLANLHYLAKDITLKPSTITHTHTYNNTKRRRKTF